MGLNQQKNIAKRNADFDLSVLDSRGAGDNFSVTAAIKAPLTSTQIQRILCQMDSFLLIMLVRKKSFLMNQSPFFSRSQLVT